MVAASCHGGHGDRIMVVVVCVRALMSFDVHLTRMNEDEEDEWLGVAVMVMMR